MKINSSIFFLILIILIPYYLVRYDTQAQDDLSVVEFLGSSLSFESGKALITIDVKSPKNTLPIHFNLVDKNHTVSIYQYILTLALAPLVDTERAMAGAAGDPCDRVKPGGSGSPAQVSSVNRR